MDQIELLVNLRRNLQPDVSGTIPENVIRDVLASTWGPYGEALSIVDRIWSSDETSAGRIIKNLYNGVSHTFKDLPDLTDCEVPLGIHHPLVQEITWIVDDLKRRRGCML